MEPILLIGLPLIEYPHMAGCGPDQLFRGAGKEDLPAVDHHELIAHGLHILDDVGGEQDQPVLGRVGEQISEVDPLLRVQSYRGLIKNQEGRVPQNRLGNTHPLALSAGERADFGPGLFLQIDCSDRFLNGRFGISDPFQRRHIVQKLRDGQLVKQTEILGQIPQPGFQQTFRSVKGLSIHQNFPSGGQEGRHQQLHQCGLTGPVGAQKSNEARSLEFQIQVL